MAWVKLVKRNDWGSITIHLGGPVVGGRFKTNLSLEECPPVLEAGNYQVRWPDGAEETLPVVMKPYSDVVYDMGHEYPISGKLPYFVVNQHGAKQHVYAMDLGAEVWKKEV